MCGDMVNDSDDQAQLDELWRITGLLDDAIPMHWAAGNHDVGNELTPESLATYRRRFGEDNYFFDHGGSRFVVLNSNVAYDPSHVPEEWERQVDFLRDAGTGREGRQRDSECRAAPSGHPCPAPRRLHAPSAVPQGARRGRQHLRGAAGAKARPARPSDLIRGTPPCSRRPLPQEQLRAGVPRGCCRW